MTNNEQHPAAATVRGVYEPLRAHGRRLSVHMDVHAHVQRCARIFTATTELWQTPGPPTQAEVSTARSNLAHSTAAVQAGALAVKQLFIRVHPQSHRLGTAHTASGLQAGYHILLVVAVLSAGQRMCR